jgi:hypothetical protein
MVAPSGAPRSSTAGPLALALGLLVLTGASQTAARPVARSCFSATAAPTAGVLVWGGARACGVDVVVDNQLWSWDGAQWQASPGPPIEPRDDALLLPGPKEGALTLFGGRREGQAFDDVWVRESETWRRVEAEGGPGPIQHGAAALDPVRQRIVVFGGAVGSTLGRKTHEWDGARWHEFEVEGPAPRVGHGMAWSRQDGGVLLYGGFADEQRFRDLWRWDGASWKRLAENGPTYTEGPVVAQAERGLFVIGPGLDEPPPSTVAAWNWNGEAFVPAGAARPPLRIGAAAVYDRARGVLVLWGGSSGAGEPDASLWEFDGREWREPSR